MEKEIETTILYRGYIGITENTVETTVVYSVGHAVGILGKNPARASANKLVKPLRNTFS